MNQTINRLESVEDLQGNVRSMIPVRKSNVLYFKKPTVIMRDGRYALYDNGILCDCYSGLEWLCGPDEDTSWVDALEWAEKVTVGGGGWSLPTVEALCGLYKKNRAADLLTPLFKRQPGDVWSKEAVNDAEVLGFNFVPGNQFRTYKTISRRFRAMAVRPRQHYLGVRELKALRPVN